MSSTTQQALTLAFCVSVLGLIFWEYVIYNAKRRGFVKGGRYGPPTVFHRKADPAGFDRLIQFYRLWSFAFATIALGSASVGLYGLLRAASG